MDYLQNKKKREFIKIKLLSWSKKNYSNFAWRRKNSPFHSLIAEILLQRTKAEQVEPVFVEFRKRFPSITSLQNSTEDEILKIIGSLGLYWRVKQIKRLASHLIDELNSRIPRSFNELNRIPGVGAYAASSFLSLHSGIRAPIVDSNIVRLYSRYFGFESDGETRRKRWLLNIADKLTPTKEFKIYNYALLDFTRKICTPKPHCEKCILNKYCSYYSSFVSK